MPFYFADLFAGIGGFHAALKSHGGQNVFISELDPVAAKVYDLNWNKKIPGSKSVSIPDVRIAAQVAKSEIPDHQVLTAGFPCQPFSKSGMQHGVKDRRGTLFHDILEIARVKKPEIILLENVRNLIGPRHVKDYKKMLNLLRENGYAVSSDPTIVSPHQVPEELGGSPQHRQRLFIAAYRVGKSKSLKSKDLPPIRAYANSLDDQILWDVKKYLANHSGKVSQAEVVPLNENQEIALSAWNEFIKIFRRRNPGQALPGLPLWSDFWNRRNRIPSDTPDWKRAFIRRNQELYLQNEDWINAWYTKNSIDSFIPSFRKFEWQAKEIASVWDCLIQFRPSGIRVKTPNYVPTFVAMAQTPFLGWERRALTVSEAAVLQGFPKNFQFGDQNLSSTMKQIGNAVHPGVVGLVFGAVKKQAEELGIAL